MGARGRAVPPRPRPLLMVDGGALLSRHGHHDDDGDGGEEGEGGEGISGRAVPPGPRPLLTRQPARQGRGDARGDGGDSLEY